MESLSPFLWGSCIPYNMPVYPGARPYNAQPVLLKNSTRSRPQGRNADFSSTWICKRNQADQAPKDVA